MTQRNDRRCEQYCMRDVRKTQKNKIKVLLQAVETLSVARRGGKQMLYFNGAIYYHKLQFNVKGRREFKFKSESKVELTFKGCEQNTFTLQQ